MTAVLPITLLELLLCAAVTWPLLRQLGSAPFRQRNTCLAWRRLGALAVYLFGLVIAALFLPAVLHVTAGLALLLLMFERWRARADYGRKLPPGSLSLVPLGHERDPGFHAKQIATFGPVFKLSLGFRPCVFISGHARAARFLRDNDAALLGQAQAISATIPNGFLRYMPPDVHTRYRRILRAAFTPQALDDASPFIRARAEVSLAAIAQDCGRTPTRGVVWDGHLRSYAREVLFYTLFGVKPGSSVFAELHALYHRIDAEKDNCGSLRRRHQAMQDVGTILTQLGTTYEANSTAPPPCVLAGLAKAGAPVYEDTTVIGNLATMAEFGTHDSFGLLQWLLKMLVDNPETLQPLRSDATAEEFAARFVKETLRLERSEFLIRVATREISFDGYRVPKGWTVRIGIREAHRDPNIFDEADKFDPDRFLRPDFPSECYAPFGLYRHHCLGSQIAQRLGESFLLALGRGYEIDGGFPWPIEFAVPHWQPCQGQKLALRPRAIPSSGKAIAETALNIA